MRRPRNSAFLPVSGWVRTIGCRGPGTFDTSPTGSKPFCALPPPEKQRFLAGCRRGADHRLPGARHFRHVLDGLEALMRLAAARMRCGVDHGEAVNPLFRSLGQGVVGRIAIEELGCAADTLPEATKK